MKTNNLTYKVSKTVGKETIYVSIRLNDEYKNGHEDFSITADIYEAGKPKTDRYFLCGGCCHDEILKFYPEFKIFVNLHLCTFKGVPMYSTANGFYHVHTKKWDKEKFLNYYRLTENIVNKLYEAKEKELFSYIIFTECLPIWEQQANEAINELERLTGNEFEATAIPRFDEFAGIKEILKTIETNIKNGYYSTENINKRETIKINEANKKLIDKYKEERKNKIDLINLEYDCLDWLCGLGISLNNFIFYSHSKEAHFNWKGYEKKLTKEQFKHLQSIWKFPEVKLTVKEF